MFKNPESSEGGSNFGWAEKTYYPEVIMDTIKTFYKLASQPASTERDTKIVNEINIMMKQIEIFEGEEIIAKEFDEITVFLDNKKIISYSVFIELLHKLAVVCQRIWYHKGLLLTPVPYKEKIYKDILEKWQVTYPEKFPELKKEKIVDPGDELDG